MAFFFAEQGQQASDEQDKTDEVHLPS